MQGEAKKSRERKYKVVLKDDKDVIVEGRAARVVADPATGWIQLVDEEGIILFAASDDTVQYVQQVHE
jgi:hypothetical protein